MPLLNPLTAIAGPESSFGQNTVNPDSSARGIWQDLSETWQGACSAVQGGSCGYATANDAPASVQAAANAWLYNQRGFQPWTCANCGDNVLVQEIANAGGASAFAPQGSLSQNPADYASLDTPAGLQAYFSANPGGSFVGAVPLGNGGGAPEGGGNAAPNASPTAKPYSYAYSLLVTGSAGGINNSIQQVQQIVHPYLAAALALSIMVVAIATMLGRISINGLFSHAIRVSLVLAFVAPGSAFYTNYVINPVAGLPASLASGFGVPNAGPAGVFDDAYLLLWTMTETVLNNTHISFTGDGLGVDIAAIVLYGVGIISLTILFVPYLAVNYLLLLMLVIGPVAIVAALFRVLDRWLMGFVDTIATLAVLMLAIDMVIVLYQTVMVQVFSGFVPTGVGDKDIPAFGGLVLVLAVMAFTVFKYLTPFVSKIFGGVGLPLDAGAVLMARAARFARS